MESTRSSEGDLAAARYRDLHRPRSSNAPRKRTRFAPARPNPSTTSNNNLSINNSIRSIPTPNGRLPNATNGAPRLRSTPLPSSSQQQNQSNQLVNTLPSVYDRIARAHRFSELRTKPDPRFIAGHRALESMGALKSSLAVSLFDNGFVRHDHILGHAMGINASGGNEILSLARLPYSPASQHFLKSLENGILPDEDDLPEPSLRTYYEGCLVAEVFDYRGVCDEAIDASGASWRKRAWFQRVLLRPDSCSHVADVNLITCALDDDKYALAFESRLLSAKHPNLDLDPTPQLQFGVNNGVTKNPVFAPHAGGVIRRKRLRERCGDVPPRPPVSMSALLLIDAAEKNQTRSLLMKSNDTSARTPAATEAGAELPEHLRWAGESTAQIARGGMEFSESAKARGVPPTVLFEKANERHPPTRCASYTSGSKNHERLRTIRLLFADRNSSHIIRTTRNAQKYGTATQAQIQLMQKTLAGLNRKGQPVCVLELVSRPARGCDVALFRGMIGDKARDVNKIELATVEEAHNFLNQFKKILDREGYICIQDGDPAKVQIHTQQANVMDARRRAMIHPGQIPMQVAAAATGLSPAQRIQAQQQAAVAQAQAQAQARNAAHFSNQQAALRRAVQAQQFQRQAFASTMTPQQLAAAKQQAQFANMLPLSPVNAMRAQQQRTPQGVQAIPHSLASVEALRARQVQHAQMIEHQARLRAQSTEPIPTSAIGANAIPPSMLSIPPQPTVAGSGAGLPTATGQTAAGTGDTASQRSRGSGSRGSRKR